MNPDPTTAEYETAWRRVLAGTRRQYWLARLRDTAPKWLPSWKMEVIEKLRREWEHRTPMERCA